MSKLKFNPVALTEAREKKGKTRKDLVEIIYDLTGEMPSQSCVGHWEKGRNIPCAMIVRVMQHEKMFGPTFDPWIWGEEVKP